VGLYKRSDSGTWWMTFSVNGKSYRRSTETSDDRLAKRIWGKLQGQIAEKKWFPETVALPEYTFRELATKYEEWARGRQRAFKTWKQYVIKTLVSRYGDMYISGFNMSVAEQLQSDYLAMGRKPSTANRLVAVLGHMFTKAVDWEMMSKETANASKVKLLPEHNRRLRYLSNEECHALIDSCDPHLKPIVVSALNTGMLKGEILNLKWDNVDLKHGFIKLDCLMTKNGERREIPINGTLKALLQGITRRLDVPYVFHDPSSGKPYGDVKKSFKSALTNAKIRDFHFHDLRHTFASHLVMAGIDITTVKELLGHKTLTMTLRYAHLAPSHKVKAVDVLDKALSGNFHDSFTVGRERGERVLVSS